MIHRQSDLSVAVFPIQAIGRRKLRQHLIGGALRHNYTMWTANVKRCDIRQRLLAALHSDDSHNGPRERLTPPANNEMPKDYAPKPADATGTLDESFGLKGKKF